MARVEAIDRDADANGRVVYSLGPSAGDMFSITADGHIVLEVRCAALLSGPSLPLCHSLRIRIRIRIDRSNRVRLCDQTRDVFVLCIVA